MKTIADKIMLELASQHQRIVLAKALAISVNQVKQFGRKVLVFNDGSKLCFYPKQDQWDEDLLSYYTPV